MGKFDKPEGQTTSDNFLKSEIEKDFFRAQSGWGEVSDEDFSYVSNKGFKAPADLLKSYRELEKAYSSKVSIPKDGDKKGFDKLYERLGMPQDIDGFEIDFLDEDKEIGSQFKKVCLENNILPQSAKALYDWFVKSREEELGKANKSWEDNSLLEMKEVEDEWGSNAKRNMEMMKRGIRMISSDEDVIENMEQALGTKEMMKTCCRLGEALSEDNCVAFGEKTKGGDDWSMVEYFSEMFNQNRS